MLTALIAAHLAAASLLPATPASTFEVRAPRRIELHLPVGPAAWVVAGGLSGAVAFGVFGSELELAAAGNFRGIGLLVGSLVGAAIGYSLGWFAKQGWVSARYATLALTVLAAGGLAGETYRVADGFQSGRYQVRVSWGGLIPMY